MTLQQQTNLVAIASVLKGLSLSNFATLRTILLDKLSSEEKSFVLDPSLETILREAEILANGNTDSIHTDIAQCPSIFSIFGHDTEKRFVNPIPLNAKCTYAVSSCTDVTDLIRKAEHSFETLSKDGDLSLFVDDLDTYLLTYFHALSGSGPVPLYDLIRQSMALSCALWRSKQDSLSSNSAPLLLIQGDFFGIQNFIFSSNPEHNKKMAQILRGKSAGVTLLMEMCITDILETLELSPASLSRSAAGKFLIIAPNSMDALQKLEMLKDKTDQWFLENFYGEFGIGLSWIEAHTEDFSTSAFSPQNIKSLMNRAARALERAKSRKFSLNQMTSPVFTDHLTTIAKTNKICPACDRRAANQGEMCHVCSTFRELGSRLSQPQQDILWIYRATSESFAPFGYSFHYSPQPERSPVRRWDIRLPEDDGTIYHAQARRTFKAFTPHFQTFEDLASQAEGIDGLIAMKADIDNLGYLFAEKIHANGQASFAKSSALSRSINHFFTHRIAYLLSHTDPRFRTIYTVFAGGDDLFLIGTWNHMLEFVKHLKADFDTFFDAASTGMSFSAGLAMFKSGVPVPHVAQVCETHLELSKGVAGKSSLTLFGESVAMNRFGKLMEIADEIADYAGRLKLSSGYLRSIISYGDQAQQSDSDVFATRWISHFRYSSQRNVIDKTKEKEDAIQFTNRLGSTIQTYKGGMRLAMFPILYKQRGRK